MGTKATAASASAGRSRRRFVNDRRLALAPIALLLALMLVAAAPAGAAKKPRKSSARAADKGCTFTGARWTIDGRTGTEYAMTVLNGVSCKDAIALARPLTRRSARGSDVRLSAPSGWSCESFSLRSATVAVGGCVNLDKAVSWAPRGGKVIGAEPSQASTTTQPTETTSSSSAPETSSSATTDQSSEATGSVGTPGAADSASGGGGGMGMQILQALAIAALAALALVLVVRRARAPISARLAGRTEPESSPEQPASAPRRRERIPSRPPRRPQGAQASEAAATSYRHKPMPIEVDEKAARRATSNGGRQSAPELEAPAPTSAGRQEPPAGDPERELAVRRPPRSAGRESARRTSPASTPTPAPASTPRTGSGGAKKYAETGSHVASILAAAEETARGIVEDAMAEAERLRKEADGYADERAREARENASRITAKAADEARALEKAALEAQKAALEAQRQVEDEEARLEDLLAAAQTVEEALRRAVSSGQETFGHLGEVVDELTHAADFSPVDRSDSYEPEPR